MANPPHPIVVNLPNRVNLPHRIQPAQSNQWQPPNRASLAPSWPGRFFMATQPLAIVANPAHYGQSTPCCPSRAIQLTHHRQSTKYNRGLFVPLWPTCPIVANPTHRGQPTPSYRGSLAQSCQPATSCPTGSIQSMAATQSCLTCPIVAGPPLHGHPAPCNRGEPTPLRLIHYMSSKPRHPIDQPAPSWPTHPVAPNPRPCNRGPANSSQRHASRAKPGQDQARPGPSQLLLRQARLI